MFRIERVASTLILSALLSGLVTAGVVSSATPKMSAGIYQVTNANDAGPGSLRSMIVAAAPGDTIVFDAAVFSVPLTISLQSELEIGFDVTIDGSGSGVVTPTISGNDLTRVFNVTAGRVTLNRLNMVNGNSGSSPYFWVKIRGGAILNSGVLTVTNSSFINNLADDGGGGIHNDGSLVVANCIFATNAARPFAEQRRSYLDASIVTRQPCH